MQKESMEKDQIGMEREKRELGIYSLHNGSSPEVVLRQKRCWSPLEPSDTFFVQSHHFPGSGKVRSCSVRVHAVIRGGVPITHTTICLLIVLALVSNYISFQSAFQI